MTQRRRIDGLAVTTAGESGLRRHYGNLELVDVAMAVSLDLFGPLLFVIASERDGGIDLSIGYTASAIAEEVGRGPCQRRSCVLTPGTADTPPTR